MTRKEVEDKFGNAADTQAPEDAKFQLPCRLVLLNENQYGEKLREILTPEKPNAWACTSVPIFISPLPQERISRQYDQRWLQQTCQVI